MNDVENLLYKRLVTEGSGWDVLTGDWGYTANNIATKTYMGMLVFHRVLDPIEIKVLYQGADDD